MDIKRKKELLNEWKMRQPEEQTEKLLALLEKCQLDMPQAGRI